MYGVLRFFLFAVVTSAVAFGQQQPTFASLKGLVTDAGGAPLRKAALTLRPVGGAPPRTTYSATSDSAGRYSFDAVEPGTYMLSAERAGYLQKMYRASPRETMSQITLAPGEHLGEINLALTRLTKISGSVLDKDGDPVAGVVVSLLHSIYQNGRRVLNVEGSAFTNDSGRYEIEIRASGEYYLMAGMRGEPAFTVTGMRAVPSAPRGDPTNAQAKGAQLPAYYSGTFYPDSTAESAATPVKVVAGTDVPGMDIHLQKTPAFLVKGKVTGNVPEHMGENCRVALISPDRPEVFSGIAPGSGPGGRGAAARLENDGSFRFPNLFPPGSYQLIASCSPPMMTRIVGRDSLTIDQQDPDNVVLKLQPLVTLHGVVAIEGDPQQNFGHPRDSGAPPAAGRPQVSLDAGDSAMLSDLRAKVSDDGSFVITNIAPGTYRVRLFSIPAGAYFKSARLDSAEARDAAIEINDVTSRNPLRVTLSRSMAHIEGFVQTEAGKPAPRSAITLVEDPPGTGTGMRMMSGVGDNARFVLPSVPPGTYRLYAWEDLEVAQHYDPDFLKPYMSKSVQVTVGENGTANVVLTQIPAAPDYQDK